MLIAAPERMSYLRYAALIVMVQSYCSLVVLWAWILSSFPSTLSHRGTSLTERLQLTGAAVAIALINTAGYAGGSLPGSFIFPSDFGPSYLRSFVVTLVSFVVTICLVLLTRRYLARLNAELSSALIPIELSVPATPRPSQSRIEAYGVAMPSLSDACRAATVNSALTALALRQQLCARSPLVADQAGASDTSCELRLALRACFALPRTASLRLCYVHRSVCRAMPMGGVGKKAPPRRQRPYGFVLLEAGLAPLSLVGSTPRRLSRAASPAHAMSRRSERQVSRYRSQPSSSCGPNPGPTRRI